MNPRIELVSDDEVRIVGRMTTTCYQLPQGFSIVGGFHTGDRDALEALRDVVNCALDTGSFAALADTSGVPYTGKRMRGSGGEELQVVGKSVIKKSWWCVDHWGCGPVDESLLRPLTPAPPAKYKTFAELADGDSFKIPAFFSDREFHKVVTTPFGNECAVDGDCKLYLFKGETPVQSCGQETDE